MANIPHGACPPFTQESLADLRALALASLRYDPKTGLLIWRTKPAQGVNVGDVAGSIGKDDGYVRVSLANRSYKAHRLIWLMVHGRWPNPFIDHKNRIRSDNRLDNLREATGAQNTANSTSHRPRRLKGAYWRQKPGHKGYWYAVSGRDYLGAFASEHEAHAAYLKAAALKYGEFLHAG